MATTRTLLTPEMAKSLLATNYEKQRKLSNGYAATLARDIRSGKWNPALPNNALIISNTGKLLDGKHRCKAVMIAGIPIEVDIETNASEDIFHLIDCNKPRYTVDFVNTKHRVTVSSLGKFAVCLKAGVPIASAIRGKINYHTSATVSATRTEILEEIEKNVALYEKIAGLAVKLYEAAYRGGSKSGYACGLYTLGFVEDFKNIDLIEMFVEDFARDIPESEVVAQGKRKLVSAIVKARTNHFKVDATFCATIVIATYDKYVNGGKLGTRFEESALNKYNRLVTARLADM